jgi:hypothetical protein
MIIPAKFPGVCAECGKSIAAGDEIEYRRGRPAEHAACHKNYYEISVAHSARVGCDAEYCDDDDCTKNHYHTLNCRCADCCAADVD